MTGVQTYALPIFLRGSGGFCDGGGSFRGNRLRWRQMAGRAGRCSAGHYGHARRRRAGGRAAWQGSHHSDGDSRIDFTAEYNFGDARLAAERDRSSASAIDLTRDAFGALLLGRTMVASATQGLSLEELDTLRGYRDRVLAAWEKTIAASAIHAINDVLEDVASFDNERYDFEAHARHWSALKGLVLGLQFNPRHAIVRPEQRLGLDAAVGAAPVLADADRATRAAHQGELRAARSTLFEIYGFDPVDLGDDNGAGGW